MARRRWECRWADAERGFYLRGVQHRNGWDERQHVYRRVCPRGLVEGEAEHPVAALRAEQGLLCTSEELAGAGELGVDVAAGQEAVVAYATPARRRSDGAGRRGSPPPPTPPGSPDSAPRTCGRRADRSSAATGSAAVRVLVGEPQDPGPKPGRPWLTGAVVEHPRRRLPACLAWTRAYGLPHIASPFSETTPDPKQENMIQPHGGPARPALYGGRDSLRDHPAIAPHRIAAGPLPAPAPSPHPLRHGPGPPDRASPSKARKNAPSKAPGAPQVRPPATPSKAPGRPPRVFSVWPSPPRVGTCSARQIPWLASPSSYLYSARRHPNRPTVGFAECSTLVPVRAQRRACRDLAGHRVSCRALDLLAAP